ncbi:hypothetical protein B0T18DRAFT_472860 [Schizothecium vesticola]|uniref:CCHC-type domain-containing protein n=1 Tax=Schizothecium vesticola TaxID=314040 RepID=A0AA40K0B7_9PEZI|nr:hypothetical protein B0T18DRAFT_472860 [Schizothecium vesticola]
MAEASISEAPGASAPPSQNAGPTLVAGQKRPAEIIDLVSDESPKGRRKQKKQKKSKSRKGSGASVAASLEEGEMAESTSSSNPSRPDSAASETAPAAPPGGWNTGVSSGLRISFGAKADKAPSKPAPGRTESNDAQTPAASTSSPVDDWQWPLHSLISFQKPPRKEDSTKARFSRWYVALAEANKTREDIQDAALVKEAWGVWLRRHPEMNQKWVGSAERDMASVLDPKAFPAFLEELSRTPPEPPKVEEKEQATGLRVKGQAAAQRAEKEAAARAKEEAASQRADQQAAAQRAEDAAAHLEKQGDAGSPPEEGEALSPDQEESTTTLTPEEIGYLHTYFPGVNPREPFCVSCAEYGHYQADCQPCSVCTSWTHRSYQCHTLWRCERCDQTGHGREACRAKLAAAPEEKGTCHFCQLPHNERQCPLLSQSYVFDPSRAHKIKALTPSCYHCGGGGHFGPQCASNPQRLPDDLPSAAETWTMQNLLQYIDADSEDYGIEGAAQPPARNGDAPPTHAPRNHIFFEEADDDDDDNEPFLRPSVKKQGQQGGQMSFAPPGQTMFSGPPGTNGSSSFNPPLPLGPPPPLPPPASSLPPLPSGPPPPRQQRRGPSSRGRGGGGGGRRGAEGEGGGGGLRGGEDHMGGHWALQKGLWDMKRRYPLLMIFVPTNYADLDIVLSDEALHGKTYTLEQTLIRIEPNRT